MEQFFGENCNNFHVESWKDAMEAIKNGEADYAVLPIENSSAGIVSENYDLLVEYDNYIVGEQIIRIDHALLGLEDADERDIRTVYSHKQSLMQCSEFLDSHADWENSVSAIMPLQPRRSKRMGRFPRRRLPVQKCPDLWVESITQFHSE